MQRFRPIRRCSSFRGITLLEVLLASALSLVLIAAVYAALDQSWRLMFSGKVEMERNQIARAVLRQMELDIRAVMFQEQTADSSSSSSSSSSSTSSTGSSSTTSSGFGNATSATSASSGGVGNSSTSTTSTSSDDTQTAWTGSLGIRGNMYEIFLDVSHVSRQLEFQPDAAPVHSSDLQTVAYFLTTTSAVMSNGGM